jgi:hypothetical protein
MNRLRSIARDPLFLAIISTVVVAILAFLGYELGGAQWPSTRWYLVLLVALILNLFREFHNAKQSAREPLNELLRELVKQCTISPKLFLEAASVDIPKSPAFRAHIMFYNPKEKKLVISDYHQNLENPLELKKKFKLAPGQGLQGMAFAANEFQMTLYDPDFYTLPLSDPKTLALGELRGYIPKDTKWGWAYPLTIAEEESPIGVLYVDTVVDLTAEQADKIGGPMFLRNYANMISFTNLVRTA